LLRHKQVKVQESGISINKNEPVASMM